MTDDAPRRLELAEACAEALKRLIEALGDVVEDEADSEAEPAGAQTKNPAEARGDVVEDEAEAKPVEAEAKNPAEEVA